MLCCVCVCVWQASYWTAGSYVFFVCFLRFRLKRRVSQFCFFFFCLGLGFRTRLE